MYERDPTARARRVWLSAEPDVPLVRLIDAGEDLDQRGLARPVLSDQGVYLPAGYFEVDAVEGESAGEFLGQAFDTKQRNS